MGKVNPALGSEDVQIISREARHRGFLRVDSVKLRYRLHEGGWSQSLDREVLLKDHAVGVLLYDPDADNVVLVRQFRAGVIDEPGSPWLLELVAGLIDTDEGPEQVALRETEEESGLRAEGLLHICNYYNSPGASNENVTLYCGRVDSAGAGGIFGLDHENEDIQVVVLSLEEALTAMRSGAINNAMSIIALQWLEMNKPQLVARWESGPDDGPGLAN